MKLESVGVGGYHANGGREYARVSVALSKDSQESASTVIPEEVVDGMLFGAALAVARC